MIGIRRWQLSSTIFDRDFIGTDLITVSTVNQRLVLLKVLFTRVGSDCLTGLISNAIFSAYTQFTLRYFGKLEMYSLDHVT